MAIDIAPEAWLAWRDRHWHIVSQKLSDMSGRMRYSHVAW